MDAPTPPPRPMGKVLGRQPEMVKITPSRANIWYGGIIEGQRFTYEQLRVLKQRSIDPDTVEAILVTRNATNSEAWWPARTPPPVYQFYCPVVHRRKDGKVAVLCPIGDQTYVFADGWTSPPPRKSWLW